MLGVGETEGKVFVTEDGVRKEVLDAVDGDGKVIDTETSADGPPVGAHNEPYAPLPGRNNRSCICAVWYVLGIVELVDLLSTLYLPVGQSTVSVADEEG